MLQSTNDTLRSLHQQHPSVPFLALGQTALWDETMKAVLCSLVDQLDIKHKFIVAVHNTDYFAKLPNYNGNDHDIVAVAHNDGSTKELWSAAGELSALFGSESIPTREMFAQHHVSLEKAASASGLSHDEFIDEITEAWGWRGLVHTGVKNLLSAEVCACHGVKALIELFTWAEELSLQVVGQQNAGVMVQLRQQILMAKDQVQGCLSGLFKHLFPYIMQSLYAGCDVETSCSTELFRFNNKTFGLPRFYPVSLFLNPATRHIAEAAYNAAVQGSDIYTLDRFGLGATPFDVASLGLGRGTLLVRQKAIEVDFEEPIIIPTPEPVTNLQQLAQILEDRFGPSVVIVGKAVSLISMMTQEFIPVMNEEGSMYVFRSKMMHDYLNAHGVTINSYPILRLRYPTWDALTSCGDMPLQLPQHLANAFGTASITCLQFGHTWRSVIERMNELMDQINSHRSPREAATWLAEREGGDWHNVSTTMSQYSQKLSELVDQAQHIGEQTQSLYDKIQACQDRIQEIEQQKGDHYREFIKPLREQLYELKCQGFDTDSSEHQSLFGQLQPHEQTRHCFDEQINDLRQEIKDAKKKASELKPIRMQLEKGPENKQLRKELTHLESVVELKRAHLLRDAYLVVHGLKHTQNRPTGWWVKLVDPSGNWFNAITNDTEAYLQEMS